ncbi:tryptophan synthase alpha chain [Chitinophaga skermanii]|uniref:Tryptophan synthase alpha chain n=1 Tax=Chitinophaga skermanii TaxID=331697 RepID=A0A327QFJ7_9BACT|nr:tryptophan synthase subunit alpha [Chitinophaga skermanii]RAJ02658.1 tryptophan synthase alpha chain [Chitinophaga skermanii]
MNRIDQLFAKKQHNILNIYCTAGYPQLDDTLTVLETLQASGVDMIELGMPFSDPLADGPVIQDSSTQAIKNGMKLSVLFQQLAHFRNHISVPVILMGYLNPVLQYGIENFVKKCAEVGIDGLIIPDLPMAEYEAEYKSLFEQHNLHNIFLVTPETSEARIRKIDSISKGFIYAVSSSSTTGNNKSVDLQQAYFQKLEGMQLSNPVLVGFGIRDKATFTSACEHTNGAIIGTAFVQAIAQPGELSEKITSFVQNVRPIPQQA